MKKLTVLSIVAASLLLVGCNESSTGASAKAAGEAKVETPAKKCAAGKCGEGKCGAAMKKDAATEAKEAAATAVEKTKEAVAEKATAAVDSAKAAASEAKEAVTEKATAAVDAAKAAASEAKEAVTEKATAAVDSAKAAAASVAGAATAAVASATGGDSAKGKTLFAKCAGCHGVDGKTKALGKSAVIAGQAAADLETKINGYKAGTRNVATMGALMKGQVASLSDEDIKAIAAYVSGL